MVESIISNKPKEAVVNLQRVSRIIIAGKKEYYQLASSAFSGKEPAVSVRYFEAKKGANIHPGLFHELAAHPNSMVIAAAESDGRMPFEHLVGPVKQIQRNAAFVLLTDNERFLDLSSAMQDALQERGFDSSIGSKIDYIFKFGGWNSKLVEPKDIFRVIEKVHADHTNYQLDTAPSTLLVEDKPRKYTDFLMMMYGIDQRVSRLLLARSFEEAMAIIKSPNSNILNAILDMRFPKAGVLQDRGGFEMREILLESNPKIQVAITSGDQARVAEAQSQGIFALWDHDKELFRKMAHHYGENFGFGPFILRNPATGEEIFRVRDYTELCLFAKLADQPVQLASLFHHARKGHFTKWMELHLKSEAALFFSAFAADFDRRFGGMNDEIKRLAVVGALELFLTDQERASASVRVAFGGGPVVVHANDYAMMQSEQYLRLMVSEAMHAISEAAKKGEAGARDLELARNDLAHYAGQLDNQLRNSERTGGKTSSVNEILGDSAKYQPTYY